MRARKIIYTDKLGEKHELYYPIVFSNGVCTGEHNYIQVVDTSTCTEGGFRMYVCKDCHHINVRTDTIGHTSSEWIIDTEATETTEGSKHKECTRCGEVLETATIPKLLTYTLLSDDTYAVSATDTDISGSITIPSEYNGKAITKIAESAFSNCENITSVKFAEGSRVHTIGSGAFWYCSKLEEIMLPDSVSYIQSNAFSCCDKLAAVNVSANSELDSIGSQAFMECYNLIDITNLLARVTRIYKETFQGCSKLPNVTLPLDLDEIGDRAFDGCYGFTQIHIPAQVFSIGEGAFRGCINVETITVDENNTTYHSEGNCLIETETDKVILGCENSEIPATASAIGGGAFYGNTYFAPIKILSSIIRVEPLAFGGKPVTIYCEALNKPKEWADDWCDSNVTVVWGYKECMYGRHDWSDWEDVHPNACEVDGMRERKCSRCGEIETELIKAMGHDWDTEVEVVEPTCTEDGYMLYTCNACGDTHKEITKALGHNLINGVCTRCGYSEKKGVVYYGISAIPETYNSAFVLGLENWMASNSHLSSISARPLANEYIYYCAPTSFGECAFMFNNFVGGFTLIETISVTNAGGKTEAYNIYKSNQANLGVNSAITITIKGMG